VLVGLGWGGGVLMLAEWDLLKNVSNKSRSVKQDRLVGMVCKK